MKIRKSDCLNKALTENKSCFKCINFKTKPFSVVNNEVIINIEISKQKGSCKKNRIGKFTNIDKYSINEAVDRKEILLMHALKSPNKYKKISMECEDYDSD